MLNLSTVAATGTQVGYTVVRRKDLMIYDPSTGNFITPPATPPPLPTIEESKAPYLGLYRGKIADDRTRTWQDGIYECLFTDVATGTAIDLYTVRMVRGDDTPTSFVCAANPEPPPSGVAVPTLVNGYFALPGLPAKTASPEPPEGWSSTGTIFHASNGAPGLEQNAPAPDEGLQVVLEGQGGISQVIRDWPEGIYAVYFKFTKRASSGTHKISLRVDANTIATFTASRTDWSGLLSPSFQASAGEHTVAFVGADDADPRAASLLDRVTLTRLS